MWKRRDDMGDLPQHRFTRIRDSKYRYSLILGGIWCLIIFLIVGLAVGLTKSAAQPQDPKVTPSAAPTKVEIHERALDDSRNIPSPLPQTRRGYAHRRPDLKASPVHNKIESSIPNQVVPLTMVVSKGATMTQRVPHTHQSNLLNRRDVDADFDVDAAIAMEEANQTTTPTITKTITSTTTTHASGDGSTKVEKEVEMDGQPTGRPVGGGWRLPVMPTGTGRPYFDPPGVLPIPIVPDGAPTQRPEAENAQAKPHNRDVGPVLHPGSEEVHFDLSTQTMATTTLEDGKVMYGPVVIKVYHTHPKDAMAPQVPGINPSMTVKEYDDVYIRGGQPPAATDPVVTEFPSFAPGPVVADDFPAVTTEDSSNMIFTSVIFRSRKSLQNYTVTATDIDSNTWYEINSPTTTANWKDSEGPAPTASEIGTPAEYYDTQKNITYLMHHYVNEQDEEDPLIWWEPISSGPPTRPSDIAKVSSWLAHGGVYPHYPEPTTFVDPNSLKNWSMEFFGNRALDEYPIIKFVELGEVEEFVPEPTET